MDQLYFASIVFGPPAVMLLVAQACRLGLNRLIASLVVLAIMVVGVAWFWSAVNETFRVDDESEGQGVFAFACISGAVWFLGLVVSLVKILLTKNVRSARS